MTQIAETPEPDIEQEHKARSTRTPRPATVARRQRQTEERRQAIMGAALKLFSQSGLHGVSVDEIANLADVSKTNLLYYFPNKEQLYVTVLTDILNVWLEPLRAFSADQSPREAIENYVRLKMTASRDNPEASRLFCLELVGGAPQIGQSLRKDLNKLVTEKTEVIRGWIAAGQFIDIDPRHFLFSLWGTTQHYADFASQVKVLTGKTLKDRKFFEESVATVQRLLLEGALVRHEPRQTGSSEVTS